MTKKREKMADDFINRFGFEDLRTVLFIQYCEKWSNSTINDKILSILYRSNMESEV